MRGHSCASEGDAGTASQSDMLGIGKDVLAAATRNLRAQSDACTRDSEISLAQGNGTKGFLPWTLSQVSHPLAARGGSIFRRAGVFRTRAGRHPRLS